MRDISQSRATIAKLAAKLRHRARDLFVPDEPTILEIADEGERILLPTWLVGLWAKERARPREIPRCAPLLKFKSPACCGLADPVFPIPPLDSFKCPYTIKRERRRSSENTRGVFSYVQKTSRGCTSKSRQASRVLSVDETGVATLKVYFKD